MSISTSTIEIFKNFLFDKQRVLILNSKPDGDSLASSIALNYLIARMGKVTKSVSLFTIPDYLHFLQDSVLEQKEPKKLKGIIDEFDCIIMVDASEISRLLPNEVEVTNILESRASLVIDHHKTQNTNINSTLIVDQNSESTSGMIVDIFRNDQELRDLVDSRVAYYLYAGIASDTDFFSYSNVNADTFQRASYLMSFEIDVKPILLNFRETISLRAFEFIQRHINKVVINTNKKYGYLVIREEYKDDYFKLPYVNEATNYLNRALIRIVDCVNFSFIIKEISSNKCSFAMRIRNTPESENLDLSRIAEHFGGGGHRQSAGGVVVGFGVDEFTKKFTEYLEKL